MGRTVWRVADNLEKMLLCKLFFSWAKFLKLDAYVCWFSTKDVYSSSYNHVHKIFDFGHILWRTN